MIASHTGNKYILLNEFSGWKNIPVFSDFSALEVLFLL